jgi:hypothetical protein
MKEGLPWSAGGLAKVGAFEGLAGDVGEDLEVLVQVQDKSTRRVTRTAGRPAGPRVATAGFLLMPGSVT